MFRVDPCDVCVQSNSESPDLESSALTTGLTTELTTGLTLGHIFTISQAKMTGGHIQRHLNSVTSGKKLSLVRHFDARSLSRKV